MIEEREVEEFSPEATREHLQKTGGAEAVKRFEDAHKRHEAARPEGAGEPAEKAAPLGGCPGMMARDMRSRERDMKRADRSDASEAPKSGSSSRLENWPIELHLVNSERAFLKDADLLIAADCTGFLAGFVPRGSSSRARGDHGVSEA